MPTLDGDLRIAIIGGGKMGEAILAGWLRSDGDPVRNLSEGNFVVVDPGEARRAYLAERYGVSCLADAKEVSSADIVVLAVKPQVMAGLLGGIASLEAYAGARAPLFISIAAGLTTGRLESLLAPYARLVRVMPNMPLMVASGATSVTGGRHALESDVALVRDLFACLGTAVVVDESLMDATCAVSGSGPAYVARVVESLRDAGVRQGLDFDIAQELALQTVLGTALLMRDTGQTPAEVRESICSPGGTTLAALEAMENAGFDGVFDAGIAAAVRRSKELAAC